MKKNDDTRRSSGRKGSGCLTVFGAVFLIVGLIPGGMALKALWGWYQAQEWEPVSAQVLATDIEYGEDTYRVTARYRYAFGGQEYTGNRVSFHSGGDNIGDFHQSTHRRLARHRDSREPVTAWVNPAAPAEAVLVRDMRWGLFGFMMLFPLLFGGAGIGIMLAGRVAAKRTAEEEQRRSLYPDQPWRWRPEWEGGVIRSDTRKTLWFALMVAVFWNLISLPLVILGWDQIMDRDDPMALLALLFPLVGALLILWAVRLLWQWWRYGRITLRLGTFPGSLGGRLEGMLHIPARLPPGSLLEATLSCVHQRTTGSGKHRSTRESFLWQDDQRLRLARHHVMGETRIPLTFPLPAEQPPSDDSDAGNRILWRLQIRAEVPGVDLDTAMEVPVFHTGRRPPEPQGAIASAAAEEADWQRTGAVNRLTGRGQEFYFPPARHRAVALGMLLFAAIFGGTTAFLWRESVYYMAVPFGAFALLIAWAAIHTGSVRSRLLVSRDFIDVHRGLTGLGPPRRLPAVEIAAIRLKNGMRAGRTQYYDLVADLKSGRSLKLADNLPGRRDSQALVKVMTDRLGIKP
ncbi:MAG: DUF3592 domain-containing protein [Pseudomonadota bacterium]